jgi:radical SAM superfamily enzyme YgiQ (UPF0313 family)
MRKKVVLYFPRVFSDTRPWQGTPLSLLAISRLLVRQGYEIKIISDFLIPNHVQEVVRQCQDSVCLGLSCMTGFQIYDALRVADAARAVNPNLPIIWGGWHPSVLPEETAEDDRVDVVVRGEGERSFAEVVNNLYEGKSLADVAGITYRLPDGSIRSNPALPLEDINNFPPYPYQLVDIEKCLITTEYGRRTLQYISSYGCPHRCGFCIEPVVNKRRWTGLSAESVVADWEDLHKKYQIDAIAVYDSNFFVDKKRVYSICTGLLSRGIKIKWGNANGRIPQLAQYEPEIWEAMERSGCQMILTGAESGSQKTLDLINKDMSVEQIKIFTELCRKYHIRIFYSYLIGLPWSKDRRESEKFIEEEFKQTFRQIEKMMDIENGNRFSISVYTPFPGSELYNRALEMGFKAPKSLVEWSRFMALPEDAFEKDLSRSWMTENQILKVVMLTQYIFGLLDIPTRDVVVKRMANPVLRTIFYFCWNVGMLLAGLRWRFKFFALPVDFWVYTRIRKYTKVF